jgi:hypothetical protein
MIEGQLQPQFASGEVHLSCPDAHAASAAYAVAGGVTMAASRSHAMASAETSTSGSVTIVELRDPPRDFLAGELEGREFYKAFQDAGVANFEVGYLQAHRGDAVVATAPYFTTRYFLNTMLKGGWLKRLLRPFWLRIACIGHPVADYGRIDGETSADVLEAFNRHIQRKAPIICYKDFPDSLPLENFAMEPGLPVASLAIDPDWWSGLKQHVRSDFRRRLRKASALRIEIREGFPAELADRIYELYLNVHRRGEFSFETLTKKYFELVGPFSRYALYFEDDLLIGFCLLMCKGERMHYKYLGMDYERGRPHGLYFIMSLSHVEMCLREGYRIYQTGSTSYAFKQRLGSTLNPVYLYYRHRNRAINWAIRKFMHELSVKPDEFAAASSTEGHA